MSRYILALDQGTTSCRAIVFDAHGHVAGITQQELTQHFPQPGQVEHDANEIWQTQLAVARNVLQQHGIAARDIRAIGMTNQRETTVLWDRRTGEPLHRAIVWQDRRTADICRQLRDAGKEPLFQHKTGLLLDAYFSGTKLQWLLDHIPGARQRAEQGELAFGTIDSWLAYKLTGVHVTDVSNASRTLLCNIHTGTWDDELLGILRIPPAVLPRIVSSSEEIGTTEESLFGVRIPVTGIAGDQQAAAFGQACHQPGMVKNTYGTGCFLLMHTGTQAAVSQNKLLSTIGWRRSGSPDTHYMLEGSIFVGGAVVQWLRDGLGMITRTDEIESLAASVPDSQGIIFVPAFTGLGTPYWDPYARGSVLGLSRGTTRAHIARAALESIALQTADVLGAMQRDTGIPPQQLRVDGGAATNNLLMQFQADILNIPVIRPKITETTALGAAYLAGLASGLWQSEEEIAGLWQVDREFHPNMSQDKRQKMLGLWQEAVKRSAGWDKPATF